MSENRNFKLIKTTPMEVLFDLRPVSNNTLVRKIHLTNRLPQQSLPLDWALGVFLDEDVYSMYKQGYITFDDNDAIVKAAIEAGVYFDEVLDFVPASVNRDAEILAILKSGNRAAIMKAGEDFGQDKVMDVITANVSELTQGVVKMLESLYKVQLTIDGE